MSTFVRQNQDLKINTVLDRKPMKTFEDIGYKHATVAKGKLQQQN
jgi:hypothetical protein